MIKKLVYASMAFAPVLALAQVRGGSGGGSAQPIVGTATTLAEGFKQVVNVLIPAFFGLAIIYFFYGVAKYILSAGDQKAAAEGKGIMIYGVIAITIMASIYGIVGFLQGSIGIVPGTTIVLPTV